MFRITYTRKNILAFVRSSEELVPLSITRSYEKLSPNGTDSADSVALTDSKVHLPMALHGMKESFFLEVTRPEDLFCFIPRSLLSRTFPREAPDLISLCACSTDWVSSCSALSDAWLLPGLGS